MLIALSSAKEANFSRLGGDFSVIPLDSGSLRGAGVLDGSLQGSRSVAMVFSGGFHFMYLEVIF